MASTRAASRYAKALISLGQDQKNLDALFADMQLLSVTISENRDLGLLLKSPVVSSDKKSAVLGKIFNGKVSELSSKFISTLSSKGREELLPVIATEFQAQYNVLKGNVVATVTTAVKLDKATKDKVMALVSKHASGNIVLEEKIDANIIGGFVIRIGDKMIDASIQRKLNDLKKELLGDVSYSLN